MVVLSESLYTSVCICLFRTLKNPYAVRYDIGQISTSTLNKTRVTAKRTSQDPPKILSTFVLSEPLYRTANTTLQRLKL